MQVFVIKTKNIFALGRYSNTTMFQRVSRGEKNLSFCRSLSSLHLKFERTGKDLLDGSLDIFSIMK